MKNSILKKVVSVIAAITILATSTVSALAVNNYTSESGSSKWATPTNRTGCTHTIENGMLKSERTRFYDSASTKKDYEANGTVWSTGLAATAGASDTVYTLSNQTIGSGKMQAKFDVRFMGGAGQKINVIFNGYEGQTGFQIRKTSIATVYPNGGYSGRTDYGFTLADGEWYTYTVVLDMDNATMTYTVEKKDDPSVTATGSQAILNSSGTTNAITGILFRSNRDQDLSDTDLTAAVTNPTSIWYVNNVEVDAYTETNYEIDSVFRSTDGLETNKKTDGFAQSLVLRRLTNIADPANASFITASYENNGRMIEAEAKSLSEVGTAPFKPSVTGDTVKSFIFNMDNAYPYTNAYSYADPATTVRKVDFEDGFAVPTEYLPTASMANYGIWDYNSGSTGVTPGLDYTVEDGALKVERSIFKGTTNAAYKYDEDGKIVTSGVSTPGSNYFTVKLDESPADVTTSFKFKFAGTDTNSAVQSIAVTLHGIDVVLEFNPSTYGAQHNRVRVRECGGWGTLLAWTNGMKANTWYTCTLTSSTSTGYTVAITGEFTDGTTNTVKTITGSATKTGSATDYVMIGSRRDMDKIAPADAATVGTTRTSVWYIDDFEVKY